MRQIVKKWLVRSPAKDEDSVYGARGTKLLLEVSEPIKMQVGDRQLYDDAIVYEWIQELDPGEETSEKPYASVTPVLSRDFVKRLEGKLLTHVEATFTDKEQREAHKSLLRNVLWDTYKRFEDNATFDFDNATEVKAKHI